MRVLLILVFVFLACCAANPEKTYRMMESENADACKNIEFINGKEFVSLVEGYKKFIEKYPASKCAADAQYAVAQLYMARKDYTNALKEFESFYMCYPGRYEMCASARFIIGALHERSGRWKEARKEFREVIDRYPASRSGMAAPMYIANHYVKFNMIDEAKEAFEDAGRDYLKLIEEDKNGSLAMHVHGLFIDAQDKAGKTAEAAKELKRIADMYPESKGAAPALFKAAIIYGRLDQADEAEQLLRRITEDYKQTVESLQAMMILSDRLVLQKRWQEAVGILKTIAERYPENSAAKKALYNISIIYREHLKDTARADFYYKRSGR